MGLQSFFRYPDPWADLDAEELLFLPGWSDDDWARILGYCGTRHFAAGEVVMEAGEVDRSLYIVTEGYLEVLIERGGSPGWRRIATVEPGSVIGEVAFFDAGPRSATIRGLSAGELLRLSFEAFEELLAREPALGRAILFDLGRILAIRLRQRTALLSSWIS